MSTVALSVMNPTDPKATNNDEIRQAIPAFEEVIYDGGLVAWSQVLVSHLLVINGFGYMSSFGLFQSHWETTLRRSSADVAWVGSLQLFLLFFIGTLSGRAMDAGYFRYLIVLGCSMQLLGTFTTSVATQYWELVLSQGILQGLGNGLLFTPLVALVSTYFVRKRAFALGLAACGAPVGGVIFPTVTFYCLFRDIDLAAADDCPDCTSTRSYTELRLDHSCDGVHYTPK